MHWLCTLLAYVGLCIILFELDAGADTWQYWAAMGCMMAVQVSSFYRGLERKRKT